jgi:hypothetical protein
MAAGSGEPSPLAHDHPHKQGDHDHGCEAVDDVNQATKGLVPAVERNSIEPQRNDDCQADDDQQQVARAGQGQHSSHSNTAIG